MIYTHNLNIINIISCLDIFFFFKQFYHYTIYAIILIYVHHTAEPLMLYFIDYYNEKIDTSTRLLYLFGVSYHMIANGTGRSSHIHNHH